VSKIGEELRWLHAEYLPASSSSREAFHSQDEKKFSTLKLSCDLGFASVGQFERGRDISEEKHFHFLLESDMK
jgi:hypothetical protein